MNGLSTQEISLYIHCCELGPEVKVHFTVHRSVRGLCAKIVTSGRMRNTHAFADCNLAPVLWLSSPNKAGGWGKLHC